MLIRFVENQRLNEKVLYNSSCWSNYFLHPGERRYVAATPYRSVELLGDAADGVTDLCRRYLCRK